MNMNMKKFVSIVLAMVMLVSMSAAAFAQEVDSQMDGTGSITISNPTTGKTYDIYRIFDLESYNASEGLYVYKLNSDWASFKADEYFTVNENDYIEWVDGASAANFAAVAKAFAATNNIAADATATAESDPLKFTKVELGYYLVATDSGALCSLTTTAPDATINDKNDVPFEKTDDQADVEVGQTVNYTISGEVPDATGFTAYTYKVTDTMSEGLTFEKDIKVTIGGTDVTEACTIDYTTTTNGFILTIPVLNYQNQIGAPIEITYSATVNEKAVSVISKNSAKLEYTNGPNTTTTTTPDEETVYSAKIVIDKVTESEEKLAGAKFVLKNAAGKFYAYNEETEVVSWVENQVDATEVTTDETGAASFIGLKNGTYYLVETEAPAGYNLLKEPVEVVIAGNDTDATKLTVTSTVENVSGAELPETGAQGTKMIYMVGGILVCAAAILLITKRRMNAAE